ncbi:MAG: hypothetical protein WCI04_02495 [archaeon]
MQNKINYEMKGSLSYMAGAFRKFDLAHPDWGEEEHITHAVSKINPNDMMNMLLNDFNARKEGGDNIAMFICGTQGTGKSLVANYFAKTLSQIWKTKFRFENLGFYDAETSESIDQAKNGETIWQDEHDSKTVGALSVYLKERLVDFVLRGRRLNLNFIFCSPIEQDKGQFLTLETKNTRKDHKTGKPIVVECLVKTPWYFDSNQRMTRGIIFVPVDDLTNQEQYNKRKDDSLAKLKKQYGSNFDYIGTKAKEIFDQLKDEMITKDKNGKYIVKKGDEFKAICFLGEGEVKGIGSSGTEASRTLTFGKIKGHLSKYVAKLNSE